MYICVLFPPHHINGKITWWLPILLYNTVNTDSLLKACWIFQVQRQRYQVAMCMLNPNTIRNPTPLKKVFSFKMFLKETTVLKIFKQYFIQIYNCLLSMWFIHYCFLDGAIRTWSLLGYSWLFFFYIWFLWVIWVNYL